MNLPFTKYHVLGNDFILFDESELSSWPDMVRLASFVCNRRTGVGGDELVFVQRDEVLDANVVVVNPDGSKAPTCGNAILAVAHYLANQRTTRLDAITIRTSAGIRSVHSDGCRLWLMLDRARLLTKFDEPERIALEQSEYQIYRADTGTAHAVIFIQDLSSLQIARAGAATEFLLPDKTTNVMFVGAHTSSSAEIRCWERGGTGESLSCGTGAAAVTLVLAAKYRQRHDLYVIRCRGGNLLTKFSGGGTIHVSGPPMLSFRGEYVVPKES